MYEILKLNEISKVAGTVFNGDYNLVKESANPDGIVLRSFNMHEYDIPSSVLCVGRAGAAVTIFRSINAPKKVSWFSILRAQMQTR